MSTSEVIMTRGLTKDFGAGRGLFELDLEVHQGEVFGFLGPNGAGKSTTMRLLLDLIRPTSGSARVLGLDANHDSLPVRQRIGFLRAICRCTQSSPGASCSSTSPIFGAASTRACATRSPSVLTPISTGRYANCPRATVRSSVSCRRSCTSRSC